MTSDSVLDEFQFSQLFSFLWTCQWIAHWVRYFSGQTQFSFVLVLEKPHNLHRNLFPPRDGSRKAPHSSSSRSASTVG